MWLLTLKKANHGHDLKLGGLMSLLVHAFRTQNRVKRKHKHAWGLVLRKRNILIAVGVY